MAEALLSNEPRTLQEFGTLRESSTLQDISLTEVGGGGLRERNEEVMQKVADTEHEADNEHKIKSNSLKRFFRMPSKKKGSEDANPDNCPVELAEGDIDNRVEKHNPTYSGDVGLHDTEDNVCESKANSMHAERSQRDLTGSFSKVNLKASLSSYWNTVFKHKKNKKSKSNENDQDIEPDLDENFIENEEVENTATANEKYPSVVDNILTEEIHALKISDENDNK